MFRLTFIAQELRRRRGRALLRLVPVAGGARIALEVHGQPGVLTDPWGNVVRLERAG